MRRVADNKQEEALGSEAVENFLNNEDHPLKSAIVALRKIILKADSRIHEGIKWNAPSFCCGDWFATFHLRSNDFVQVILYRGAKAKAQTRSRYVEDPAGILNWITNDRCAARFASNADVKAKSAAFSRIVADWARKVNSELGSA